MKKQNKILAILAVGFILISAQAHANDGDEKATNLGPQAASKQNCKDVLKAMEKAKADFRAPAPTEDSTDPSKSGA